MTDRIPPHDEAAEEAVLGSLLLDPECLRDIDLSPDDFFVPRNQVAFRAVLKLSEQGIGVNQITVAQELNRTGQLVEAGGASHLAHVVATLPTSLHCKWYAGIVKQTSTRRKLMEISARIESLACTSETADKALADADTLLNNLRKQRSTLEVISPMDRADMMLDEYTTRHNMDNKIATKMGLPRLDTLLGGGIYPGELMVIGARPGMGKTTLAQFVANKSATKDNPVLFCSAEMTVAGLTDRDVSESTGVNLSVVRAGKYHEETFTKILNAVGELSERNVYYLPRGAMTVARIAQAAEATANRAGKLRLIVVDHLGRLKAAQRGQQRHIELGEMTSDLADLAKSMDCPVMLLCQLNRELEHRDDKRPTLNDLRESGRIEEDADIVLFMYRKGYYTQDPENVTEISVAKLRQSDDGRKLGTWCVYDRSKGFQEIN